LAFFASKHLSSVSAWAISVKVPQKQMVRPMRAALQGWTIWCLGRLARTPVTGDELALVIDIDGVSVSPFEGVLGQRRGAKGPGRSVFLLGKYLALRNSYSAPSRPPSDHRVRSDGHVIPVTFSL